MADFAQAFQHALALHREGKLEEADEIYRRVLAADPANATAFHLSGLVAYKTGRHQAAIDLIERAIAEDPRPAEYYANLGNVLKDSGRREDAIAAYKQALARNPDFVAAHNNLGVMLQEQGEPDAALPHFERAIALAPGHHRAHFNRGNILHARGEQEAAVAAYRGALALQPRFPEALSHLALALQSLSRHDEAVKCLRELLGLEADSADAHADIAMSLQQLNDTDAASAHYESAVALRSDLQTLSNYCVLLQKTCAWDKLGSVAPKVMAAVQAQHAGLAPFLLASLDGVTPAMQLAAARADARALASVPRYVHRPGPRKSRLRIGYLSADFHEHATAYLTAELFELHDRERFEIHLYSYGPDDASAMRQRLRRGADRFIELARITDAKAAARILDDHVDILVDLKGQTGGARLAIAAHRPAPIQVNWLGFPGTMGADWFDYIIADRHIISDAQLPHYAEQVERLPGCYQSNDRQRPGPARGDRAAMGLPAHAVVVCCFNQTFKITPSIFAAWMSMLRTVPNALLWLLRDNDRACDNLRKQAQALGVDPGRLIFAARVPVAEHLARYAVVDLAIDTFPYTSHTTGSDALWMACPLATLQGETFASRVAASLLYNMGCAELVTSSLADYENLICTLAEDLPRLRSLRRKLDQARASAALFDTPRITRSLEEGYERMWARWARGEPAEAFDCEP